MPRPSEPSGDLPDGRDLPQGGDLPHGRNLPQGGDPGRVLAAAWSAEQRAAARRLLPPAEGNAGLDRSTGLAARLLGVPSAMATLLTDVQHIAAGDGLPGAVRVGTVTPLGDAVCLYTVHSERPMLVPDTRLDPRLADIPLVASGAVVAYAGVPLVSDSGVTVGALCVFDSRPRAWTDADGDLLGELAAWAVADLERGALAREFGVTQARWELAVEVADMGAFELDVATGRLSWDEYLIRLYGYDTGDEAFDHTVGSVQRRVHPDDRELVRSAINRAIESVGALRVRYRIVRPDGSVRWLQGRGRAVAGADGRAVRLLGVTFDVTDQQSAALKSQRVLETLAIGIISLDAGFRVLWANADVERITHVARETMIGATLWELFPAAIGPPFKQVLHRVVHSREPESFEAFYPRPFNLWVEIRVVPADDGILLNVIDLTAQHEAQDLLQLSVQVGEELVGAADEDEAVALLARRTVPQLADWAIVSVVGRDGAVRDVQSWHTQHAMRRAVEHYASHRLRHGGSGIVQEAIVTGEVQLVRSVVQVGRARLKTDTAKEALAALGPETAAVIPLLVGTQVVGVLSLYSGPQRPLLGTREIDVAMSICRRAATVVENRRLITALAATAEHDRTVARALQEALLTRLPRLEGMQVEVRYLPAANEDQVGGDWYDALVRDDGTVALAIGDVVGHDIAAAGVMGQLRSMLRSFTWDRDDPPSGVLCRLDSAIRGMRIRALASVVAAQLTPDVGGATLTWSSAGHPPPMLLRPDGSVEVLWAAGFDIILGVQPDSERHDHHRHLPSGSRLLLYTDGLVETRTAELDAGFRRLEAALHAHAGLELGPMLDAVLQDMVGTRPDDDVAVLVLQVD